jgi:putative methionine-R-sulfoxide reductase with GAF domain
MPIDPAHLARSLGALDTLDVEGRFTGTLQQVLGSARTLLDADMAGLMLVDHAGTLRWASCSNPMVQTHEGELEQLAHGPCRVAFAQRAPAAVPDRSVEPGWSELAQAGIDADSHAGLSVPVFVGGGPVGTLDVFVTAPREWDDSEAAALQAYAGLVASLLVAAVPARVTGRLAAQLQAAVEHRSLLERAIAVSSAARRCPLTGAPRPKRSGTPPPTLRLRRTGGTRSCTRARPDATSGAVRRAGPRPSVSKQRPRVAGSSTPKPNGAAPTGTRRGGLSPARSTDWRWSAAGQGVQADGQEVGGAPAITSRWKTSW